jgi:hypothetical protein
VLRRVRAFFAEGTRAHSVREHYSWFLAGYRQAILDLDDSGVSPANERTIKLRADMALKRWVETGSTAPPSAPHRRGAER